MATNHCENCAAPLYGPYCSSCGQHAHSSARSVLALAQDALHDLTHIEGRFWPTLKFLIAKPGRLTQEYFAGRRTLYAPPFRLYLVLSVMFFALSSLIDRVDPAKSPVVAKTAGPQEMGRVELGNPLVSAQVSPSVGPSDGNECADIRMTSPSSERFVRRLCQRLVADGGRSVAHTFENYIPKTMFVFLPMVAAVLALLFRRPRRYYVEHLVLVLHNHAAMFTAMAIVSIVHLLAIGVAAAGIPALQLGLDELRHGLDAFLMLYLPWYIYRSLRTFYGLPRRGTILRLVPLGGAYLLFLGLTFGATFLLSAAMT